MRETVAVAQRQPSHPPLAQRMTLEEFEKLPGLKPYLELREGIVTQKPAAQERHSFIQAAWPN